MAMLEVRDLEVYYGMIQAIKGVSFEVNEGEVISLIGANGAGKTTILHTITGLLAPKKGSILFEGKDITKVPAQFYLKERILQRFRHTGSWDWGWRMCRRDGVYLRRCRYTRI